MALAFSYSVGLLAVKPAALGTLRLLEALAENLTGFAYTSSEPLEKRGGVGEL